MRKLTKLPADIDRQCYDLCKAINLFDDVRTVESCCGHGKQQYCIWFTAKSLKKIKPLIRVCNCHYSGWHISIKYNWTFDNLYWELRFLGGMGQIAYDAAIKLADNIKGFLKCNTVISA